MLRPALALCLTAACGQVTAIDTGDDDTVEPDAAVAPPDAEPALACAPVTARTDLIAAGPMVTEGFEASPVLPGTADQCFGPLSSTTSAPCASPGAIRPGFVLSDEFVESAIYGDNFIPNAFGRWSGPASPERAIEIRFTDAQSKVGFDFVTDFGGVVTITAFDETNAVVDSMQVSQPMGSPRFYGVSCNQPGVSRVVVNPDLGLLLVDQLSFDSGS